MKKFLAILVSALLLTSALSLFASAETEEEFEYVNITSLGADPYATFSLSSPVNPDVVKYAMVKYRTITENDSTGGQLIGQFYVVPEKEPFIPIIYNHTQEWETVIVDLTTVTSSSTEESRWTSSLAGGDFSKLRFDPLESPQRDNAADNPDDPAHVSAGDSIDIAYIALFETTEQAEAYVGSENEGTAEGCAAIITADMLMGAPLSEFRAVVTFYGEQETLGEDQTPETFPDPTPDDDDKETEGNEAPDTGKQETTPTTNAGADDGKSGGCGAAIGTGALVLAAVLAVPVTLIRKKDE